MKVSIVGTGYVGLVTGACLAEKGHEVVCIDKIEEKVRRINAGVPPIFEAGLPELLQRHVGSRLKACLDLKRAVAETDVSFIAVGTPSNGSGIDLSQIRGAAEEIGDALRRKDAYHVVTVKSTVVPGTTNDVVRPILEQRSGKGAGADFGVAMNPEFLREGQAVADFLQPDRIVLGGDEQRTLGTLGRLYDVFPGVDQIHTTVKTAEMIKYASNSLLATLISFANEIGNLCEAVEGVDVVDVMQGVHLDRRLSPKLPSGERITPGFTPYLEAGCGFGGSCFPKDVRALVAHGEQTGAPMELLTSVLAINARQPGRLVARLEEIFGGLRGRRIAVLGLAIKPDTDDVREYPALPIIRRLHALGANVQAYDPVAAPMARQALGDLAVEYCGSLEAAVAGADAVVVITRWPEFRKLPELLRSIEPAPVVIDGRRMLDKNAFARYEGVGLRTPANQEPTL